MSSARGEEGMMMTLSMRKKRPLRVVEKFNPKDLRVLVVDDNPLCLASLERLLLQCQYNVTLCPRLSQAVSLLSESRSRFDIVMCEVYLQEDDGFKLLENTGLGSDLPVVLMSAKGETSVVMRGITLGASDFLIKPIRMEELRNIWQHVVRRRHRQEYQQHCKLNTYLWDDSILSDGEIRKDSAECCSKKRKDQDQLQENDTEHIIDDISGLKKARVHWTVQLHQQFISAVNQLQIDKAVPKKILEIMKVQGLTRENVASHLQKYRLYLRRLSGTTPEPRPIASFQAAGEGKAGGSMQIRQGGRSNHQQQDQDNQHQTLSPPAALKTLNLRGGATTSSSRSSGGGGNGFIDKATLISLQQYQAYEQKRAAANEAQSSSIGGLPIDAGEGLSRKTRKKIHLTNNPMAVPVASNGLNSSNNNISVKVEDIIANSQSSSLSFTDSTGKMSFNAQEEQEEQKPEKFSSWNDAGDLFVDKFVHEYEFPNLAIPDQDFMSTSAVPVAADISDYLIDDFLAQSK